MTTAVKEKGENSVQISHAKTGFSVQFSLKNQVSLPSQKGQT